ncbi:MAG: hypothetical protein ACI4SD_05350 [Suilimivivens sp.]
MKLMRGKKRLWMRLFSLICALVLGVGGILPMGVTEVKAETQTQYTFYYYCDDEGVTPVVVSNIYGGVQFDTDNVFDNIWNQSYKAYVMKKVSGADKWWSIAISFNSNVTGWEYGIYHVSDECVTAALVESNLGNAKIWDATADWNTTLGENELYQKITAEYSYYRDGRYYKSMDAATGDDSGDDPQPTELTLHVYSMGTSPCIVVDGYELDGLNKENVSVWGNNTYKMTSEGDNWWTITMKVPSGKSFDLCSALSDDAWVMKFMDTDIAYDNNNYKSWRNFESSQYYKNGIFYATKPTEGTETDELKLHIYSTGSAPCVVTSGYELEGLTKEAVSVWGKNTYKMTSEGDNWWTITMKAPTGKSFEVYAECEAEPASSDWIMEFSDIEITADELYVKSWHHFETEPYYKKGAATPFTETNPDAKSFSDLQTLIQTAEEKKEEDYTEESFNALQEALEAAKVITESNTSDEITAAYN